MQIYREPDIVQQIRSLAERVANLERSVSAGPTWASITSYEHSWKAKVGGPAPGYSKDALGWVTCRGWIEGGTLSTTAFTFGKNYRPKDSTHVFSVGAVNVSNVPIAAVAAVGTNGALEIYAAAAIAYCDLGGIRFFAEQ